MPRSRWARNRGVKSLLQFLVARRSRFTPRSDWTDTVFLGACTRVQDHEPAEMGQ